MRVLAASIAIFAALTLSSARAVEPEQVLSLARDVCLLHGGSLPEVEQIAAARGWRVLSLPELERARASNDIGHITGWSIGDGGQTIALTISLPLWSLTPAMRERRDAGRPVLGNPPASLAMYEGSNWRPPETATMQFCDIHFSADDPDIAVIASGIESFPFLDTAFGPSEDGLDGHRMEGADAGVRLWRWSKYRGDDWQQVIFRAEPAGRGPSLLRIYQKWRQ